MFLYLCFRYKDIHEDLTSKTRIMTIVLKVLKDYHKSDSLPSFHYNNMLEELQIVAPDITEETLLQHGEFIVQQVNFFLQLLVSVQLHLKTKLVYVNVLKYTN